VKIDTPTLEGYLETPGAWHPASGALIVGGWVFSRGTPVRGVEVTVDGAAPVTLAYGVVRADVERLYSTAGSLSCGFGALVPLPEGLASVRVEFHVLLEDDRRVRWLERRVRLYEAGQIARLRRVASTLTAAIGAAARERRLPPAPATWFATLRRHWEGSPSLQPPRHTTPQRFDREGLETSYRRFHRDGMAGVTSAVPRSTPPATIVLIAEPSSLEHLDRIVANTQASADELWIVSSGESPTGEAVAALEARHRVQVGAASCRELCDASGRWFPPGGSPYVVLLDGRSIPAEGGIDRVLTALEDSGADWVFSDDDRLEAGAEPCDPYFKGTFSPESGLFDDYATRLTAVRRTAIAAAGGLQASSGEAQIAELLNRVWSQGGQIHHVAAICCHRLERVPLIPTEAHRLASAAWLSAVSSLPVSIVTEDAALAPGRIPRVQWSASARDQEATIVVPTRDRVELLRACIGSLTRTVDATRTELLIVDDGSSREETCDYLQELPRTLPLRCRVLRASDGGSRFNYARLMNAGAAVVSTPLMLHLNNDIEAIAHGWLDQMAGWFSCPGVGVVGAKLIYRDRSIQHAGVFVSPWQGTPDHYFRRLDVNDPGYQWLPHRLRNVSGVTGACLLTSSRLFLESGGFNAQHLAVQFNDVDYCLRLVARGLRVVYEPAAVLYHDESASRGRAFDYRENAYFQGAHRGYRDPFLSPHLDAESLCGPTPVVMSPTRAR
jgi:GT2 family glycosyltransferase